MKFTGQVRVPEIDHPGVPATVMVEDDQIEVFLEGESLGRWSLFDVHASRLVSAAFSLSLDQEEITFIADEPVDFAYKGVDHMAEVWARYKSMTIPRRVVAVGRSRRGTQTSRIAELREAMLQNLEGAGRFASRLSPIERMSLAMSPNPLEPVEVEEVEALPKPPVEETGLDEAALVDPAPALPADIEPTPVEPSLVEEPTQVVEPPLVEPAILEADDGPVFAEPPTWEPVGAENLVEDLAEESVAPTPPPLRPGAGLLARRITPSSEPEPDAEPAPLEVPVPEFRSPWDEPLGELEPESVLEWESIDDIALTGRGAESPLPEPEPEVEAAAAIQPPVEAEPEPFAPEIVPEPEPVLPAAVASAEVPELVKELLGTSSDEEGQEGARDLVVDLGHYEGGTAPAGPEETPPLTPMQPVLAGAPAESTERSGLFGAVRSAFARNKAHHEHEFVEAPGGIGIVRQICAECGYISIGVSD